MITRRSLSILLGSSVVAPTAMAQHVATPANLTLKISGNIGTGASTMLDRAALEALGLVSFETMTPWYPNKVRFEGVPLSKLLAAVSAKGEKLVVTALNDYVTEIPASDAAAYEVILALKRDGHYMPVSDKGPLFVVYNYDSSVELKSKKFYARSAWQVASIEVR